jgi:hypothetical protein
MGYDLARPLALMRVAIGIGSWLAPEGVLAAVRLDPAAPQSLYLLRLFAARETALGWATLLAPDKREPLLELGLVVDSLDAAAGLLALRREPGSKGTGLLTGVAAGAVLVGTAALVQARRQRGV